MAARMRAERGSRLEQSVWTVRKSSTRWRSLNQEILNNARALLGERYLLRSATHTVDYKVFFWCVLVHLPCVWQT